MTGIILMSLGGLLLIFGALLSKKLDENIDVGSNDIDNVIEIAIADGVLTPNEKIKIRELANSNNIDANLIIQQTETKLHKLNIDPETELVDYAKKNGVEFEKYVVQRFDRKFFRIKTWADDKYVDGRFSEATCQPDIQFEFKLGRETKEFALECKWRKQLFNSGVEIASADQLGRYNDFSKAKNVPVFVAIGLGGKGKSPENIFVIPLQEIKQSFIHIADLKKYQKKVGTNFFFDKEALTLR